MKRAKIHSSHTKKSKISIVVAVAVAQATIVVNMLLLGS